MLYWHIFQERSKSDPLILPIGKIPNEILEKIVFKYLGKKNNNIIEGSHIAGDSAIVKFNPQKYLVLKTDPITGAVKNVGKHVIIINSNDLAARGATPLFFLVDILLPKNSTLEDLEIICKDLHETGLKYNISIVGGHSEVTQAINKPVLVGMLVGELNKNTLLLAENIEIGDKIILTKSVGIEGCSIIAHDLYSEIKDLINEETINDAKNLIDKISVLDESILIRDMKGLKFMHDPTEGGIIGACIEICSLIKKGFTLKEENIPIYDCVKVFCDTLKINPYRFISSGALLCVIAPEHSDKILNKLNNSGINAKIIGEIESSEYKFITKTRSIEKLDPNIYEELWKLNF